jgi:type III restriction enzyme
VITPIDNIDSVTKSLYEAERNDMNDFERQVIDMIASQDNVFWWHRVIDTKNSDFYINGFIHHYPDFMVKTKSGMFVLIEVKGDFLWNDESKSKLRLGRKWAAAAGANFRYFMVFKEKLVQEDGAYPLDEFSGVMKQI